ncbi:MAG: mandelate racemase/muconate lactonizing enzyme family protein [Caldilineaceae bacterium]|nr:mandelate racemase/muconate lactonizing enzyme family protein [Caldilineaceae bacterium]MDE0461450.1 mandelate racemase/muconate lactonizing enzyme family protein [Caldilineaceae bacterium]
MRISSIKAFAIKIPPAKDSSAAASDQVEAYGDYTIAADAWTSIYSRNHETCLVRLETDDGLVGWGEGQAPVAPRATAAIVEELCAPLLLDRDPFDVEFLWYRLYSAMRERGHITGFYVDALAAVDLALYDLLGKALEKPAYKLLGGSFRRDVQVYAGMGGTEPDAAVASANTLLAAGYRALKLHLRMPNLQILAVVGAVRQAVGPEVELLVDVHGTREVSGAIELGKGLEALGVRWLEAPCQPEDIRGQAEIARALSMQVATGEWLRTVWEWRDWIALRGFDVAMPDVARTGLTEGKRISALCDSFNLPIAPHVGGGGILSVAATIHYSLAIPNFQIMEHGHESLAWKGTIARSYPVPQDGRFAAPQEPGLGVEIDEAAVASYSS